MSTAAAQRLLLRTATTAARNARRCPLTRISSSSVSAAATATAILSPHMRPISSPTSSQYNNNRSFSIAAATSVTRMVYTSSLDDILDPSAPSSLFFEPSSKNKEERIVVSNTKFLKCGISQDALRFKTQTYGRLLNPPYLHANEHRVTLLVSLDALPFTSQLEHDIFQEIVGSQRYNVERNELRLQSVQFASRIENKRHLVSMLDRLVLSCQTLARQVMEDEEHEIKDATVV